MEQREPNTGGPAASTSFVESLFGLHDRQAVVIGGTGALGRALAEGLARAGAQVVVAGRSTERGAEVVEAIDAAGGRAVFRYVDVTDHASLVALHDRVIEECGRVDILVNCAGVNSATPYFEVTDEEWDRVIRTNLTATHWGCQVFGKTMVEQTEGGAILNIGSVTADRPLSRVFAYSASKAAVVNLTRNLAREWGSLGVRVNALCPGFFPAEQNRRILDAERTQSILSQTPLGRFGRPTELVGAALLLLSPAAGSFITGAVLYVDGGFTSMRF